MSWTARQNEIVRCTRCPRLVAHRAAVARSKRRAFADWDYWGRPVPDFGNPDARLVLLGLAPAAHGANRTGRMFTGDRSGDFLFKALHETGFASQPTAEHVDDGLKLRDAVITAAARCAPPANRPTAPERKACFDHLLGTARLLERPRVVVALGGIAFRAAIDLYRQMNWARWRPKPKFAHGAELAPDSGPTLLACYHPSQQNTFTGRLTREMIVEIFRRARSLIATTED